MAEEPTVVDTGIGHPSLGDLSFFPEQWTAVSAPIGPALVLAGPGAGKTRCLIGRIRFLVERLAAAPERICAVTFTNKAAEEIVTRLRRSMSATAEHLWLGTIHALCLDLLRPFAKTVELPPGFGVADENHQIAILRRLRVPRKRDGQLLTLFGRRRLGLTPVLEATDYGRISPAQEDPACARAGSRRNRSSPSCASRSAKA